jgi:hypothetical protein
MMAPYTAERQQTEEKLQNFPTQAKTRLEWAICGIEIPRFGQPSREAGLKDFFALPRR